MTDTPTTTADPDATARPERLPMVEVIEDLLANLDAASLPLDTADAENARGRRDRLSTQVRNHLLPRLKQVAAPVIVVVGGSTGAGKSTIVNSVVGSDVSEAGVLRPTTREPVLVVHPKDAELLEEHPVTAVARVSAHEEVPRGLALLDAPDLDSVHSGNRGLADELVELADLWVFVTTGSRYGDAVPWARLHTASERGVSLAVVLNRVERAGLGKVRRDLFDRLDAQGFGAVPFFVIPDVGPHEGVLPPERVAEFAKWLTVLGSQSQSRSIIARTVRGAWPALRQDVQDVAAALDTQRRTALALRNQLAAAPSSAAAQAKADVASGAAATGAPTTTWLAGASSGGILAPLVAPPANVFESWRFRRAANARNESVRNLREVAIGATRTLIKEAAERGERLVRTAAERTPAGRQVAELVSTDASVAARTNRLEVLVREWDAVVADVCAALKPVGDDAGLEPDALSALVEVAAAGLDGAERAVRRIFGDRGVSAVTRLRRDLADWAEVAVNAEAEPFLTALDGIGLDDGAAHRLRVRASELKGYL
ncbi:GTPase domain-containing protein [Occultella gossypii]|uniref:GTPase domain-containing protein n=1 Tax=Occultella gossypii TaxID=2800820 RepID=A0ABS7S776_9MICO|nr:GTPase domain-containing protein [Occultella gossypii]MBZ2196202.1 GTPase domain-containing protein [Occultella gossypii]